jgi:hypothetical protein
MAGRFRFPRASRAVAVGVLLAFPPAGSDCAAAVQHRTGAIAGQLVDLQSRAPIGGARIRVLGTRLGLESDSTGRFSQGGLRAGVYLIEVRAVGYAMGSWVLRVGDGDLLTEVFELERLPAELDPVVVERRPSFAQERRLDFERRRASGRGYFITEQDIEHAHPRTLGDLFRNVPGIRMQCRGSSTGCTLRMARAPRECRPDFVIDGFPATYSTSLDMPTIGIIGIEIYRTLSETPLEFLRTDNQCGTVVVWTTSGPR